MWKSDDIVLSEQVHLQLDVDQTIATLVHLIGQIVFALNNAAIQEVLIVEGDRIDDQFCALDFLLKELNGLFGPINVCGRLDN